MNKDKSPIDSFSVSLGKPAPASPDKQLQPWNILICSDLGFKSVKPRRVHIAEWNEFMASENIVISGTIENALQPFQSPMFIEHTVSSMKDFSSETMRSSIPALSGYSALLDSLARFLDGKTDRESVLSALQKASLPKLEKDRLSSMLGAQGPAQLPRRESGQANAAVASILSMVDVSGPTPDETQGPRKAIDGLLSAFSEEKGQIENKPGCQAFLDAGKKTLSAQIAALKATPFFSAKKASWQCLMQCARSVGRKKEIRLSVFSIAADERDRALEMLAAEYDSSDASPDIILWDFPVSFTNAEIDRLALLAGAADRLKSAIIAPLSPDDRLFDRIDTRDDFSPVIGDIRFLPYKKIRSTLVSRALCLCGPDMTVPDMGSRGDVPAAAYPAHGCWPMIIRWIEMCAEGGDPFAVDTSRIPVETVLPENASFNPNIPESIVEQAALQAGLTLFSGKPVAVTIDRAKTIIDPEVAGTAYSSFAFNLLVNRVARLVGRQIVEYASSMPPDALVGSIKADLCKELIACRVCTDPDQITVQQEQGGALDISLNSDVMVGGYPARFSFSLDVQ